MPTAADYRTAAGRLQQQASWLPGALDGVAAFAGANVWMGPAADRFGRDLADHRTRLRAAAEAITSLAASFTTDAAQLDAQAATPPAAAAAGGAAPAHVA